LGQREREVPQEALQIETLAAFVQARQRGSQALDGSRAELLHHAGEVEEGPALGIHLLVQAIGERERRHCLLDVPPDGVPQRRPAAAAPAGTSASGAARPLWLPAALACSPALLARHAAS
jgi:hypothetical protein